MSADPQPGDHPRAGCGLRAAQRRRAGTAGAAVGAGWSAVAAGSTDSDGRITDFGPADLDAGVYRVSFDTASLLRRHRAGRPSIRR